MTLSSTETRTAPAMLGLFGWLALSYGAAAIAVLLQGEAVGRQYAALPTPPWAPPQWLFGPVWTILYGLIGVAAWRVWRASGLRGARGALALFLAQLILNAGWTPLFFGADLPAWALVEILALDALVVATIIAFHRHDRVAAWLMAPYLAWVLFATALNAAIVAALST